jgi:hypothetical protein
LADGRLVRPVPLQLVPAIANSGATTSSLGFRAGTVSGTEVPTYPLGYPLLMAAAMHVGGALAAHVVVPVMAGLLCLVMFALGERIGGGWAGLAAAALTAIDPVVLANSVTAMSDVPAAMCWLATLYFASGRGTSGALAAGMLGTLGTLIRPNLIALHLAPLAVLMFPRAATAETRWRSFVAYGTTALLGPLLILWTQAQLYGGMSNPSYEAAASYFSVAHVLRNVRNYTASFASVYGIAPVMWLAGLAAAIRFVPLAARRTVIGLYALCVLNVLSYLFYLPYTEWQFLRFFLPSILASTLAVSAVTAIAIERAVGARRNVSSALALTVAIVMLQLQQQARLGSILEEWRSHRRIVTMGHYLAEALPDNAVVLGYLHSGAIRYYTGRDVLTLASLPPERLDSLVDTVAKNGLEPVLVIDELWEEREFRQLFRVSRYAVLDWAPRAEFVSTARIRCFYLRDKARHARGEAWPVDVVRSPG